MTGDGLRIFISKDTWGSEVALSLFAGIWGFFLLLPFRTFESSHTFSAMAMMAHETVWGVLYLTFGIVSGVVPLMEIKGRFHYRWRMYLSMGHVAIWVFVLTLFIRSNINSTATAIYTVLTFESFAVSVALATRLADQGK